MAHQLSFEGKSPAELEALSDADLLEHSYALQNFNAAVHSEAKQLQAEFDRRIALAKYNQMNESEKAAVAQYIQAQGIASAEQVNG